jgi:hypothetical protein
MARTMKEALEQWRRDGIKRDLFDEERDIRARLALCRQLCETGDVPKAVFFWFARFTLEEVAEARWLADPAWDKPRRNRAKRQEGIIRKHMSTVLREYGAEEVARLYEEDPAAELALVDEGRAFFRDGEAA